MMHTKTSFLTPANAKLPATTAANNQLLRTKQPALASRLRGVSELLIESAAQGGSGYGVVSSWLRRNNPDCYSPRVHKSLGWRKKAMVGTQFLLNFESRKNLFLTVKKKSAVRNYLHNVECATFTPEVVYNALHEATKIKRDLSTSQSLCSTSAAPAPPPYLHTKGSTRSVLMYTSAKLIPFCRFKAPST